MLMDQQFYDVPQYPSRDLLVNKTTLNCDEEDGKVDIVKIENSSCEGGENVVQVKNEDLVDEKWYSVSEYQLKDTLKNENDTFKIEEDSLCVGGQNGFELEDKNFVKEDHFLCDNGETEVKTEQHDFDSDGDVQVPGTPPELVVAAKNVTLNLLPNKSREKYEVAYKRFMDYCLEKNTTSRSENGMIAYFSDLSTKLKASTLWSNYSMLRATLRTKEDIDISKYSKLRAFLKRQGDNYKPKKPKVLSNKQLEMFITQAPDRIHLMHKVALIFGVAGACRRDELCQLNLNNIDDLGCKLLIKIPNNKTKKPRSFVINETYIPLYRKYVACRPENFESYRFFFKYSNGKGCKQVVGIHQFGKIPQIVAKYLNLPNADEYTGHCFRQSSATILVNAGADLFVLKRHGGWKSSNIAEGFIEESFTNKVDIADKIFGGGRDKEKSASNSNNIVEEEITINSNNVADFSGKVQPIFNSLSNCNITININK